MNNDNLKLVPILTGVGVVAVSAIIVKVILDNRKKVKKITLVNPSEKYPLKLAEKIQLSHDTRLFRFALPSEEHCLGLPTGSTLSLWAPYDYLIIAAEDLICQLVMILWIAEC